MSAGLREIPSPTAASSTDLEQNFRKIRQESLAICEPLAPEDFTIQTMADVSPPKWHLAHTTWFFETFVLIPHQKKYGEFHPRFNYLFNSYYKGVGAHYPRPKRGLLSRPTRDEILDYRKHVDEAMVRLIKNTPAKAVIERIVLGLQHEQQHQELLLTDIKHLLGTNPLRPAYKTIAFAKQDQTTPLLFQSFPEGMGTLGYSGEDFSFDNERPQHRVWLSSYQLGNRLITNGEFLEFIRDGGYQNPLLWLSDGWDWVQNTAASAPLYWVRAGKEWQEMTLGGLIPLAWEFPVMHVNYYEADAYARWAGCRLPTEAEWERAAGGITREGNFYNSNVLHPLPASANGSGALVQMMGDLWEWTASPYVPYPGFQAAPGAVGEYNGKFMVNQMVLRGGSCFTPAHHIRPTYRNFFPPAAQWQATGIRLAKEDTP